MPAFSRQRAKGETNADTGNHEENTSQHRQPCIPLGDQLTVAPWLVVPPKKNGNGTILPGRDGGHDAAVKHRPGGKILLLQCIFDSSDGRLACAARLRPVEGGIESNSTARVS